MFLKFHINYKLNKYLFVQIKLLDTVYKYLLSLISMTIILIFTTKSNYNFRAFFNSSNSFRISITIEAI
jgi:hypothetical protein